MYARPRASPGAGWALDNMRGQWRVTMGVDGNTHLDAVHRVIGRPGIVLVGEGSPHRVKALIAQQKKRIARVVGQTLIYEVVVGNEEGQIPLGRFSAAHDQAAAQHLSQGHGVAGEAAGSPSAPADHPAAEVYKPAGAKMRSAGRSGAASPGCRPDCSAGIRRIVRSCAGSVLRGSSR